MESIWRDTFPEQSSAERKRSRKTLCPTMRRGRSSGRSQSICLVTRMHPNCFQSLWNTNALCGETRQFTRNNGFQWRHFCIPCQSLLCASVAWKRNLFSLTRLIQSTKITKCLWTRIKELPKILRLL